MPRSARDEIGDLVRGLGEAVGRATQDLARSLAGRSARGETAPVDVMQQEALAWGSTVAAHLERLGAEIDRVARSAAPAAADVARQSIVGTVQYVAGWVEGGGVVLALLLELDPAAATDAPRIAAILGPRVAFVVNKVEGAVAPILSALPTGAAPGPAVAVADPKVRLATLLAKAAQLGVRIKNVPEAPSLKYLDKLDAQLAGVEAKRAAAAPAAADRSQRLKSLLALADQLKVRVKQVPDQPSDAWLDKMEAKLSEVAAKKQTAALPKELAPPPAEDQAPTGEFAPERTATPDMADAVLAPPTMGDDATGTAEVPAQTFGEERRSRVEALLEKAAEAGLDLGRVPPDPSDEWLANVEAKLEQAIEKRKAERKAERKRKEAERKARIERLQGQAEELGVDLGKFPPFPTDDWLARAELRIQAALLKPSNRAPSDDHARTERLAAVSAAALERGIDLGDVPDDPDEVWLAWAEGRVDDADASEEAIAVESEGFEPPSAFLVFEEGTVQEQSWAVGDTEVTIGRGRGNTVQIRDDAGVSRKHCTIVQADGRYFIRDEGSTKGTIVNGKKSPEVELEGDEVILCGETKFVFRIRYGTA